MGLSSNATSRTRVLLIDNYDSFTWNVYQYLACEGAEVIVHRNDKITVEEAIALKPDRLVVSPGPGHPLTDSGISCDCIRHFAGKIPIFGVCMGEQCIFSVFGGTVSFAGEIVHGKTSTIIHDGKGIFTNVPQGVAVTRYHSLSGTRESLPDELEVTARTSSGIIQGVRHKKYTIEGVQFHPESILTEEGRLMIRNFLNVEGGKWTSATSQSKNSSESILNKIYQQRKQDVQKQSSTPGYTLKEIKQSLALGLAPPVTNFYERIKRAPGTALLAEVKRASPSKGIIDDKIHAPSVALTYANAGAAAISVLTEPTWFKGSIEDLRQIRLAIGGYLNRPAVLRKEFIFDEYQIAEARLAGADSVLLIVKMLDDFELKKLYDYSRELNMEPLVEVSSQEEMERALKLGAKVIGVNNRDLHSFDVDLSKTSSLASMVPNDTLLIALSGISGPSDVRKYESEGIKGILVGESLMRARDVKALAEALIGTTVSKTTKENMLVKVCGLKTAQEALVALEAGADFLGVIMVPGRSRTVAVEEAKRIAELVKSRREKYQESNKIPKVPAGSTNWATQQASLLTNRGPLLVGVFQNQDLPDIIRLVDEIGLDLVQLHGNEPREWANFIPVPVIQRMDAGDEASFASGLQALSLYDGQHGGTGDSWDWSRIPNNSNAILAGGLNPDNVLDAVKVPGIIGVDVSTGVETNGKKDAEKIRLFLSRAKGYQS